MPFIKIQKKHCQSIHFAIVFPIGSLDDPVGKCGVAHIVEHIAFRKAGKLTQEDIYDKCESLGVKIDAKTGKNFISFQFACRKSIFKTVLSLLYEMLKEQNYSQKDLQEEKSVVLAEIVQKEPTNMQLIFDSRWTNTAFSNSILGTETSIANISLTDIIKYKNKLFLTDFSIVLVGNFDETDLNCINNLFTKNPTKTDNLSCDFEQNIKSNQSNLQFIHDKGEIIDIYYSYHSKIESDSDALCLFVLDNIFFRGYKSFITEYLREKQGFVYEIDSDFAVYSDELNWIFQLTVKKSNLTETIKSLERLLHSFVLNEQYFQYVKAFCCDNLPMLYDDMDYLCSNTIWNYINLGMLLTPEEFAQKILNIPICQYNDFFKRIGSFKNVYIFGKTSNKMRKEIKSILAL